jgi:electron transfer flavoprotein beta subunit
MDESLIGLKGSPTKVKAIENVVFKSNEVKEFKPTKEDMKNMVKELVSEHIIG